MAKRKKKSRYHTGIHESPKVGECKYRSGWELKYMLYLDENPDVISYEYEPFEITYVSNKKSGRIRRYIPDIMIHMVDGSNVLVEIKPARRLNTRIVQKKASVAEDWCRENNATYKIITEIELKALGLFKTGKRSKTQE